MSGSTIALLISAVLAAIAVIGAWQGLRSGAVAKTAVERSDQLEKLLDRERIENQRERAECDRKVTALTSRVDDFTNGWLDNTATLMAPKVAAALEPLISAALKDAKR